MTGGPAPSPAAGFLRVALARPCPPFPPAVSGGPAVRGEWREGGGGAFAAEEPGDWGPCQGDGWLDANGEDGAADLPLAPPPDFDWDRELGD